MSKSPRRVGNLPAEVTVFVGRRREVAEAKRLLAASRLVTLTGVGGVGKTRLALRVAGELQRGFPDGAWLVELADLSDPGLLPQTVASAVGARSQSARHMADSLASYLAGKRLLLVLDNCEHLSSACAELVGRLLATAPGLVVLATGRQALRLPEERVLRVPPMSLPEDRVLQPARLLQYEAVNLFAERASAAVSDFHVTPENSAAVARLCRRLDGIPLAIELAAVQLRALSPEQVLERLDDRYRLLRGGSRIAAPRHQTLHALIGWSFGLCTAEERTLWMRVSVFSGGFDLDAAKEVCCVDDELAPDRVAATLRSLVDRSVLIRNGSGDRVRYRLLETIQHYGRNRLRATGVETVFRSRHRDWYQRMAARAEAEWFGPDQVEWSARLRQEHANLRAALDFCLTEPGEARSGLAIAGTLRVYWLSGTGFVSEGRRWLDQFLALDQEPSPERVKGLWCGAWLAALQNDVEAAEPMLAESRALARRFDDDTALAYTTQIAGLVALHRGDLTNAVALIRQALRLHEATGDPVGTAHALIRLATAAVLLGDAHTAVTLCTQSLAMSQVHGERWFRAHTLWVLGIARWEQGGHRRAIALEHKCIRLKSEFDDLLGVCVAIEALAWIAATERAERAATLFGGLSRIWQVTGLSRLSYLDEPHHRYEAMTRHALGDHAYEKAFRRGSELSPDEVIGYALEERAEPGGAADEPAPGGLTRRERQIAELLAEGYSNKKIAATLVISERTAESHVENILKKLGFTSRTQVAAWVTERPSHPA
ncbi:LuxR C-terminal-related transcriptional regulator [Gandjariella thermophila]|uniref:LuxR family transcriptional regulator n=1 Tax=Gandjariella thermophila TaxID=1931992 RepID=A0A4D4JA29_9PSEU|nr:LuxR C-terminal-related transcriptional regulator [Gandjariella thermophila]GDY31528.1 LuxR family transcriptional regulator [Gandjariella thermophila]